MVKIVKNYSQFNEDILIAAILFGSGKDYSSFFVDVGANDGRSWSNSYFFGLLGWGLLLVEPIPKYAEYCRELYAENSVVIVEEKAISAKSGFVDFFITDEPNRDLLQMGSSLSVDGVPFGLKSIVTKVETLPLKDILTLHNIHKNYAVLSVDAEGHDLEVLETAGFGEWSPIVPLTEALELFSSPSLIHFLQIIFECSPLLFQSLSFDQGSQQGLHQDTAYVVVDSPLHLAACWIALEDVTEGAGELEYAPGSHRLPDWNFGRDRKHWNPSEDGSDIHNEWAIFLVQEAQKAGGTKKFLAKKGDILIWHADLAHGGTPVTKPELTRQSLVGHLCPITTSPYYFQYNPNRATIKKYKSLYYSSQHYDL